ncbi:hypothetical protein CHS0354_000897 [Potamilus streckersoni]|uniref:Reelin domain-containing protein n=1 Tax=Potamilus streckersoni TaxID=2493646 RepID=A0AAE0SIE8_9BIVA|nr:hypothetical protein CHS0354_000897 [Potamilus streckersoni]
MTISQMMDYRNILADSLLLGILIFGQVMCYPNGAPQSACSSMIPNHGASASSIPSPYNITTSKSTYKPNEEITVIIKDVSGENAIRGFLIQPRRKSSISHPNTVGSLTGGSMTRNPCTASMAALTHTNNNNTSTVNITWKAPADARETVVFVATIVQRKEIYWLNIQSPEVKPAGGTSSSGRSTTVPTLSCSLICLFILHKYVKQQIF